MIWVCDYWYNFFSSFLLFSLISCTWYMCHFIILFLIRCCVVLTNNNKKRDKIKKKWMEWNWWYQIPYYREREVNQYNVSCVNVQMYRKYSCVLAPLTDALTLTHTLTLTQASPPAPTLACRFLNSQHNARISNKPGLITHKYITSHPKLSTQAVQF